MKRYLPWLLLLLLGTAGAQQLQIYCAPLVPCDPILGPVNTSRGDQPFQFAGKVNKNFGQLYGMFGSTSNLATSGHAVATDFTGLFTGSCSASTFLRGDGACAVPAGSGSGSVTSVALTVPSWMAVAGSPITTSGTLAVTGATGQTTHLVLGTGSGGTVALGALTGADLPLGLGTTPSAGQLLIGNAGGTAYAATTLGGDCTVTSAGVITCLKTNNVAFGTFATQNYATPPAIGGTTPAAGTFTALTANNLELAASQSALGNGLYNGIAGNQVNVSVAGASVWTFGATGEVAGTATGGAEGAGTLNAQGLYVNGTPVSSYPITQAETNQSVTPTVLTYPPGNAFRYGCTGDGVTDDTACLQADAKQSNDGTFTAAPVYLPRPKLRYLCNSSATCITLQNSTTLYGDGKYATFLRCDGTCTTAITTGTAIQTNLQETIRDLSIELNQASQIGIDASRMISSTIRSVRVVATGTATGTIGINSNVTNSAWSPFFDILDDYTADSVATGILFNSNTIQQPNRWRISNATCLSPATACFDGENLRGAHLMALTCDQQPLACIKLGASADGVYAVNVAQETAAGGYLLDISPAANRFTLDLYRNYAGTLYKSNNGFLGTRGLLVGQWDDGIEWTDTATSGTITAITQAASAVITINTVSGTNPFVVNEVVYVSGVSGMTQINGLTGTVTAVGGSSGAWTLTVNINSSAFSAWTSGGTVLTGFVVMNQMVPSAQTLTVAAPPTAVPAFAVGTTTNATTNATLGNLTVAVGQKFISNDAELYPTVGTNPLHLGTFGAATLGLWTNDLSRISIASTGAVTVNAPTSGTHTVAGATTINASNNATTGINTGTTTSNATIGGVSNVTQIGGPLNLTSAGAVTAASWTTAGLAVSGTAETLTDSSVSGTITRETAAALPAYTVAATNTSVTITNLDELYLPAPVAGTNVTGTNKWSLDTAGGINTAGLLQGSLGETITGAAVSLNASSNFSTSISTGSSTGAVHIADGTGAAAITIGNTTGPSTTTMVGATTINASANAATSLNTGTSTGAVHIGDGSGNNAITIGAGTTGTVGIASTTSINASNNAVTNINTGTTTSAVHIADGSGNAAVTIGNGTGKVSIATPLVSVAGTRFSVASGTGACATSSTLNGGVQAGDFTCTGTTGASTATLTLVATTTAYTCWGRDITTPTTVTQTGAKSTTSVTLTLTSVTANDVIQFGCLGY